MKGLQILLSVLVVLYGVLCILYDLNLTTIDIEYYIKSDYVIILAGIVVGSLAILKEK